MIENWERGGMAPERLPPILLKVIPELAKAAERSLAAG